MMEEDPKDIAEHMNEIYNEFTDLNIESRMTSGTMIQKPMKKFCSY